MRLKVAIITSALKVDSGTNLNLLNEPFSIHSNDLRNQNFDTFVHSIEAAIAILIARPAEISTDLTTDACSN
jgi:hypothetical protein